MRSYILFTLALLAIAKGQKDPYYKDDRKTMVHLFEWKFSDIAEECETFLGPHGYGGVQVSPVNENMVIETRPWWERYQPLSMKIATRSGNETEFRDMVRRCNAVDVRIYVDAVFNHMSTDQSPAIGTGGSIANPSNRSFPAVPYNASDFHRYCIINNYNNATEVRDCQLGGLHDLDQSREHVRERIVDFLNRIVDAGVAGYRVDAAKHMWPEDLKVIYSRVKNLNTTQGFRPNARPFIYQEVIDFGNNAVSNKEYTPLGTVVEFKYSFVLGKMFRGQANLSNLESLNGYGLLPSDDALVMVDNHDTQRGSNGDTILTYKDSKKYRMATAFMLAYPYGFTRVMSSYAFTNIDAGPPADSAENILSPVKNGTCTKDWVCEHRWKQTAGMVIFQNVVKEEPVQNWWSNGNNQIAFSRGSLGFIVINGESTDLNQTLNTGLPAGKYCDIISGGKIGPGKCEGQTITVDAKGKAVFSIGRNAEDGVIAIDIGSHSKL